MDDGLKLDCTHRLAASTGNIADCNHLVSTQNLLNEIQHFDMCERCVFVKLSTPKPRNDCGYTEFNISLWIVQIPDPPFFKQALSFEGCSYGLSGSDALWQNHAISVVPSLLQCFF
mmetsp:Transcript_70697/g.165792  ORF Transcript_70697/g.165792 Transcript_70697/m.165792 type:complete len:116 (-) Transcript_70697:717-1064(-)